jgi:hypothetical protein
MTSEGLGVGGHVRRKISADADGGPSRGSHVRRPGGEDPNRPQRKLNPILLNGWGEDLISTLSKGN